MLEGLERFQDKHDRVHYIACYLLADRGLGFSTGMTPKPSVQHGCLRRSAVLA